jgi:ligand-binding SRPBCC domain-containing protein
MARFTRSIEIAAPLERVYEFHLNPSNLTLIAPPFSRTELVATTDPQLKVGTRVTVRSIQAGIHVKIEAEVIALEAPVILRDRQVVGPFHHWTHTHRFETIDGGTRLTDEIEYSLPMGPLGGVVMGRVVAHELREMFAYRQEQTRKILEDAVRESD